MAAVVRAGQYEFMPKKMEGRISVQLAPHQPIGVIYSDLRRYDVFLDGDPIGWVESRREESWRQMSSGVRYSKRGNPKSWAAHSADSGFEGNHYMSRAAAAIAVARRKMTPDADH